MKGLSVIVTGSIACGAVRRALMTERGELERRFPSFFAPVFRLDYAVPETEAARARELLIRNESEKFGAECILNGGAGGIFKTLWDLGEMLGSGMSADMKMIPVRQETIEICDYLGKNPYEEDSEGMLVIAAGDGFGLHEKLLLDGIPNTLIGVTTDKKARTLRYLEHLRYIDKPRP